MKWRNKMKKVYLTSILFSCLSSISIANAGTLEANIAFKGANQRLVWETVINDFEKQYPDISVKASFIEEEAYKVQLPSWLTTVAPDIVKWHVGERMSYYAKRGLLEDLSSDWSKNQWNEQFTSLKSASSFDGKQYALPTDYFSWGIFYRKDLFSHVGIEQEPQTWDEFMAVSAKLKQAGITPIVVGGRDAWTLAAWFDYLDLRINGYDFHMQLMKGQISYTDQRVKAVYEKWKTLIDEEYFIDNSLAYTLDSAQPIFNQGKAAMFLMGTFLSAGIPEDVKQKTGYFQFPTINQSVKTAEDGSAECLMIPARAKNKEDARKFLQFVGTPEISSRLAKTFGSLPANNQSALPDDAIAAKGFQILSATQGGIAQFYDRDMTKEMADNGMKGMQKFVRKPQDLDSILEDLEKSRIRIYKL
jgi:multiple sugar transport system substrate-binding protein